jgi:L-asparaginase II
MTSGSEAARQHMIDPIVVEVTRGGLLESRHRGAVAVVDAAGTQVFAAGDVAVPVFPRSAVKPLQALPLVETGAAEKFKLSDEELALCCASHSGEPAHVRGVERILAKAGFDASALACGTHWPASQSAAMALARTGAPSALHNNCSGKHAGFLCVARAMEIDPTGYWRPGHPVQQRVHAVLEDLAEAALPQESCAVDGCSVPTWALPLENLALAFAKFGSGRGLTATRAAAAARLFAACVKEPWSVAGSGRFCTEVMQLLGSQVLVKTGAEGVMCAALPAPGLGIAVKCDDGAGRAAEVVMAAMLLRFLPLDDRQRSALARFAQPTIRNWNGIEVGELRLGADIRAPGGR